MGRHKDPNILKFIEAYRKKGELWGFKVNDEFQLLGGLYFVDLIWTPYEHSHAMFITFEIEKDGRRAIRNLEKLFGTPTASVEKPYQHYTIIHDCKLTKGDKQIIQQKATQYNIHLFENIKNDSNEKKRLDEELEQLRISVAEIIKRKGKVNLAETVQETIAGLKNITPVVIIDNERYSLTNLTFKKSSIKGSTINFIQHSTKLYSKYQGIAIIPIPSDKFVLLIPGTPYTLDVYLNVKVKQDLSQYHAEACDYPFLFDFLKIKDDLFKMGMHIDPTQADVVQLAFFEKIVKSIDHVNKVEIFSSNGKKIMHGNGVKPDELLINEVWHNAISDLAQIQKATGQRIPAPPKDSKLYNEDLLSIENLKTIVDTGQLCLKIKDLSFNAKKETVKRLLEYQKTSGKLPKMKISISESSKHLLNQEFQLGPVVHELPEMKFQESVSQVENKLKISEPKAGISVTLIPYSNPEVKSTYSRWQKK